MRTIYAAVVMVFQRTARHSLTVCVYVCVKNGMGKNCNQNNKFLYQFLLFSNICRAAACDSTIYNRLFCLYKVTRSLFVFSLTSLKGMLLHFPSWASETSTESAYNVCWFDQPNNMCMRPFRILDFIMTDSTHSAAAGGSMHEKNLKHFECCKMRCHSRTMGV